MTPPVRPRNPASFLLAAAYHVGSITRPTLAATLGVPESPIMPFSPVNLTVQLPGFSPCCTTGRPACHPPRLTVQPSGLFARGCASERASPDATFGCNAEVLWPVDMPSLATLTVQLQDFCLCCMSDRLATACYLEPGTIAITIVLLETAR